MFHHYNNLADIHCDIFFNFILIIIVVILFIVKGNGS